MALRHRLTLFKKEKVASNAWAFVLEQPEGFEFRAGQYVRIFDPVVGESVFRDFTIASSPQQKDNLLLIVKEGISEYKQHLLGLEIGEKLLVDAPLGRFYIQDEDRSSLVFIAGGIGITPFYSMITDSIERNLSIPITLISSFSKVEDMLFFKELNEMEQISNNLQIAYTITQPAKSSLPWDSHVDRISEDLIKEYVRDIYVPTFLISGSPSFVIDMEDLLTSMKIRSSQIKVEVFLGFS